MSGSFGQSRHQSQSLTTTLMCSCGEEFTTQVYDEPEEAMTRVQIRHAVHEAECTLLGQDAPA